MLTKRRNIAISSIVPIILLFLMGSIIGKNLNKENEKNQIVEANRIIENTEQNRVLQQNQVILNNEINNIENGFSEPSKDNEDDKNTEKEFEKPKEENNEVIFDETIAFIGNSRTQGFIMYNGLSKVQDYTYIGLMVDTAMTKEFVKQKMVKK